MPDTVSREVETPPYVLTYWDQFGNRQEVSFKPHQTLDDVIHVSRTLIRERLARQTQVVDRLGTKVYSDFDSGSSY